MRDPIEGVNPVRSVIVIVLCVGYFLIQRHYWPDLTWNFPPALVLIFGCLSAYTVAKTIWWKFRDGGYRVQVGGVSGSINGPPVLVSDPSKGKNFYWALFGLGAVPPFKGRLGLLVVPFNQLYLTQGFFSGLTMSQPWNIFNLPSVVQRWLDNKPDEFNTDKIFFGEYSKTFIDSSGVDDLSKDDQLKAKNSLIESYHKTNVKQFDHYEEVYNMFEKFGGKKSLWQKAIEAFKRKDEDKVE